MSKFAENLRYYRKERKLTQLALGEKVNMGYTIISMLESGRIAPDSETTEALAKALDIPVMKLLGKYN